MLGACFSLFLIAWIADSFVTTVSRSYAVSIFVKTVKVQMKAKENSFYLIVWKMKQAKTGISII